MYDTHDHHERVGLNMGSSRSSQPDSVIFCSPRGNYLIWLVSFGVTVWVRIRLMLVLGPVGPNVVSVRLGSG